MSIPATITQFPIAAKVILITPDEARALLGDNVHNRRLRQTLVLRYAEDMAKGNWLFTGDSIKIAKDGTLLDGQHRLAAVIEANVSVEFLVVSGLELEAQENMDSGSTRTVADALTLRGYPHPREMASIARLQQRWSGDTLLMDRRSQARGGLLQYCTDYREEIQEAAEAACSYYANGSGLSKSLIGVLWMKFSAIDRDDADYFFSRLKDGLNLDEGDPIYILRRWIDRQRDNASFHANTTHIAAAVTIKAWNAWRRGQKISQLSWRAGGARPEAFPVPV